jgi:signal transduction histidine kinase
MSITPVQEGTSILRPRARLIKTIGEELISSDKVALIELVKNSYDADASIIVIEFKGKVETVKDGKKEIKKILKEGSSIEIYDDGTGMSLETIKNSWMEPASISKKLFNKSEGKNRRFTGEKGIGRFSSARLSSELEMITRTESDNEVVVNFTWSDFENIDLYLDEVKCNWKVREPIEFIDDKHGTKLLLKKLNSDWDEEKIRDLRVTLQRLINPVVPVTGFLIELKLPKEFKYLSGLIEPPEPLTKPNYTIKGKIDENGIAKVEYKSKKQGFIEIPDFSLLKLKEKFKTGPFEFDFRIWDRDPQSLKEIAEESATKVKEVRNALDEVSGISIYRDGFRVLPYGDPRLDWLRLDLRRVNNPTLRISNNQIIGFIAVELEKNPEFTDQSNREGIVDSDAFDQLKEFVITILNQLEIKRYEERPRENTKDSVRKGLFQEISISSLAQLIHKKYPNDPEVKELLSKTEESINKGIKKIQEVLSRYRRLSTLGLLMDSVLHDGNNFLSKIDTEVHLLTKSIKTNGYDNYTFKKHTTNINESRKVLAQLFKRLEPFGGRKRSKPKLIPLEKAIANVFGLYHSEIDRLGVIVELPESETDIFFDESEFQIIFFNLLQNSLYWLETIDGEREIIVSVEKFEDEISIIFSDNGPGIKEEHYDLIFDPYFSTRPDGIGLGLTIIGELVIENNGSFYLIEGPLEGATFKLTIPGKT